MGLLRKQSPCRRPGVVRCGHRGEGGPSTQYDPALLGGERCCGKRQAWVQGRSTEDAGRCVTGRGGRSSARPLISALGLQTARVHSHDWVHSQAAWDMDTGGPATSNGCRSRLSQRDAQGGAWGLGNWRGIQAGGGRSRLCHHAGLLVRVGVWGLGSVVWCPWSGPGSGVWGLGSRSWSGPGSGVCGLWSGVRGLGEGLGSGVCGLWSRSWSGPGSGVRGLGWGLGSGVHDLGQALGSRPGSWLGSGIWAGPGDGTEGVESFPPGTSVAFQHLLLHPPPRAGLQPWAPAAEQQFIFPSQLQLGFQAGRAIPSIPTGGRGRVRRASLATGHRFIRELWPGARGPSFCSKTHACM